MRVNVLLCERGYPVYMMNACRGEEMFGEARAMEEWRKRSKGL